MTIVESLRFWILRRVMPCTFYRVSVKALIWNEDRTKFLVAQERKGIWETPGGGLDWGETPEECLRREMKEEMGLVITNVYERPVTFFASPDLDGQYQYKGILVYEVTLRDTQFTLSDECVAIGWVTPQEARDHTHAFPNVKQLGAFLYSVDTVRR
jgi:8-oxo-dGTP pyrophosphatase MutT (NUDIX family)